MCSAMVSSTLYVLWHLGIVQTHVLILVQRVQAVHLRLAKLKVKDLSIGDDAFFGVGFRKGDEPVLLVSVLPGASGDKSLERSRLTLSGDST